MFYPRIVSTIIIHESPDLDALLSAWLLVKFGKKVFQGINKAKVEFRSAGVEFVPTNPENAETLCADIRGGQFDHHDARRAAQKKCSALLVAEHLGVADMAALKPLLKIVNLQDTTGKTYELSRGLTDDRNATKAAAEIASKFTPVSIFEIVKGMRGLYEDSKTLLFAFVMFDSIYESQRLSTAEADFEEAEVIEVFGTKVSIVKSTSPAAMKKSKELYHSDISLVFNPDKNTVALNCPGNRDLSNFAAALRIAECLLEGKDYDTKMLKQYGDHYGWFLHSSSTILLRGSDKAASVDRTECPFSVQDFAAVFRTILNVSGGRNLPDRLSSFPEIWGRFAK